MNNPKWLADNKLLDKKKRRLFKSRPLLKLVNSYAIGSPTPTNISYFWNFAYLNNKNKRFYSTSKAESKTLWKRFITGFFLLKYSYASWKHS